jgi:pimeloyl-ACP methyl ester carboxylesterase
VPGSLSERVRVPINGADQGMIITSRNVANPVLLFLHGFAMPGFFLNDDYPTGLENEFTVCWWEQRGAGLSYDAASPATMTVEQFIADTIAVTNYLRQRFHVNKIYLMGHSWGSFIGIQAAARAPQLYDAYIGVGQMSNQMASEKLAYDYMLQRYQELGNTNMVSKLRAAPVTAAPPLPADYLRIRDEAMNSLGLGTTHDMRSVIWGLFLPSWRCRAYTIAEKLNLWHGKVSALNEPLKTAYLTTDLTTTVTALDIPVYFLHGRYDYTVSYSLAKQYLVALSAPVKGFYTFDRSAHSPVYEQPNLARTILRDDVLTGNATLADPL